MNELSIKVDDAIMDHALRVAGPTLTKHMKPAIGRTILEMARSAKRFAPKAMSILANSIVPFINDDGLYAEAGPHVNYGPAVELATGLYGPKHRPSGKLPPVSAILDWIKVKQIQPDDPNMDQEDLSFLIARSIAARGTPKQPYMEPAFEEHADSGLRRIDGAIAAAVQEIQG